MGQMIVFDVTNLKVKSVGLLMPFWHEGSLVSVRFHSEKFYYYKSWDGYVGLRNCMKVTSKATSRKFCWA